MSAEAIDLLEDLGDDGLGTRTEHLSGAELAGLIRSAQNYALAKAVDFETDGTCLLPQNKVESLHQEQYSS